MRASFRPFFVATVAVCWFSLIAIAQEEDFTPLFPKDGVPKGWIVTGSSEGNVQSLRIVRKKFPKSSKTSEVSSWHWLKTSDS